MIRALAILALASTAAAGAEGGARAPAGALACSGCHAPKPGADAVLAPIAGRPADEIVALMAAYRAGGGDATVMPRIAKGFSDEETRAIAAWLERQR